MKRFLLLAIICLAVTACNQRTKQQNIDNATDSTVIDYNQIYDKILDRCYNILTSDSDIDGEPAPGTTALEEIIIMNGMDDALDKAGYTIKDISGDEIPELIIGGISNNKGSEYFGHDLYSVYTCVDGAPCLSFEGWARSNYRMMKDGKLMYQGSGGAMYSMFGIYTLSTDGTFLTCNDYYFTAEKDETYTEIAYFHNKSGKAEKSASEELSTTSEKFWEISDELEKQTVDIQLTPFSKYKNSSNKNNNNEPQIKAQFSDDAISNYKEYDTFIACESEGQTDILFSTNAIVNNFKILALTSKDYVDDKMVYDVEEIHTQNTLTPDRPLLVTMTFWGDIPNNGISYITKEGETKRFTVEISGSDGSIVLSEF